MNNIFNNIKFLSTKGKLNRRNFIINFLILTIIKSLVLITPLIFMVFSKPELIKPIYHGGLPFSFIVYKAIIGLVLSIIFFPTILCRIRDIFSINDENKLQLISTTLTVFLYMGYTPVGNTFWGSWLTWFILAFLMMQLGQEQKKDEIIKFNWGAFFGTWVWGLANKTYKTLWILPLYITPAWLPFQIICGLKGNEWAYNQNKYESVEKFHNKQASQSTIFFFLAPIIYFIIFSLGIMIYGISFSTIQKYNPSTFRQITSYVSAIEEKTIETSFDKIEYANNETKFYINPEIWAKSSKSSIFNTAVIYVFKKNIKNYYSIDSTYENINLIKGIKIYSTYDNKLLADFNLDEQELNKIYKQSKNNKNDAEFFKALRKGYTYHD